MDDIDQAFAQTPRANFLPEDLAGFAQNDVPLPIGFGQTNSQPTTVRLMLEWLEVESGNKVLDVGSGSGWTTALLARLGGPKGKVFAVELIPELVEFGRQNCQRLGVKNVKFYQAGKVYGLSRFAPYDRILVSASAQKLPKEVVSQLSVGGKMVIPVGNDVLEITKTSKIKIEIKTHPGFVFVPLVRP